MKSFWFDSLLFTVSLERPENVTAGADKLTDFYVFWRVDLVFWTFRKAPRVLSHTLED